MGYHMAVTDLKEGGTLEELATLPDEGITSYKLFMAYKGALMVDDETLFRTMEVAAETGRARDGARRERRRDRRARQGGARRGATPSRSTTRSRARPRPRARRRTARSSSPASPAAPLYVVHVSCERVGRADRARAREGLERPRRDVHAVLLRRLHVPRAARLRGREVRLHAAAARQGEPGRALERRAHGHPLGRSRPTTARSSGTGRRRSGSDDFSKIPNGGPGLENRLQMIHEFGVARRPDLAQPDGRAALDEPGEAVRPLPAQGHDRGRLRRGHRRLRPGAAGTRSRPRRTTRSRTTTSTRAPR